MTTSQKVTAQDLINKLQKAIDNGIISPDTPMAVRSFHNPESEYWELIQDECTIQRFDVFGVLTYWRSQI